MTSILTGKYAQFTTDMKTLITAANHMHLNVFADADGTTVVNSDNGTPIVGLLITTTNYTYPHTNAVTGETVSGSFIITFSDGSKFTIDDNHTSYWYSFDEIVPKVISALV